MRQWYDLNDNLPPEAGTKAYNLSKLMKVGVNVPNGSVVLHSASINAQLIERVADKLNYPLIVRSSSNIEDGNSNSMAGVFSSHIAKDEQEVIKAIHMIQNHSHSKQVLELLAQYNISEKDIRINYLLQEYKNSRQGGVLVIPESSENKIIIEAGDSPDQVTAGQGVPRTYQISLQNHGKHTEKWLNNLLAVTPIIRAEFSGPQDVEWLETPNGVIYILQARPYKQQASSAVVIAEEQQRLLNTTFHKNSYTTDKLPDIDSPTPLTLSLMQKIYCNGMEQTFSLVKTDPEKLFPVVAGQIYFDTAEFNSLCKPAILHPVVFIRHFYRKISLIIDIARHKRLRNLNARPLNLEGDIPVLYQKVKSHISQEIFKLADELQIVRGQLQKKLKIAEGSPLLWDLSKTPLQNEAAELDDQELIDRFWYLSGNEYELSAKRFSEQPKSEAAKNLRNLAVIAKNENAIVAQRAKMAESYLSIFDAAYIKNLFTIYDTLNQERANLHDTLINTLACLRQKLVEQDKKLKLNNTIWYANIVEAITDKLPDQAELQKLKDHWVSLQNLHLVSVNDIESWRELAEQDVVVTQNKIEGTELSFGKITASACLNLEHTHAGKKTIFVTRSLSHEIIVKKVTISGVVTERGGRLSHVALLAREHNLPIIRVLDATKLIKENDQVALNTEAGYVSLI